MRILCLVFLLLSVAIIVRAHPDLFNDYSDAPRFTDVGLQEQVKFERKF
jgi:1,4-dihydroxy-2-naphthoate octaprenyltransferase